jgi:competence protein ComEA
MLFLYERADAVKQFLRDYFSFNKRERNGILALLIILAVLLIWISAMKGPEQGSDQFTEQYWPARESTGTSPNPIPYKERTNPREESKASKPLFFYFDPNAIGAEDWLKLGLTARQAKVVINYVNKGGKFKKKEDLEKIYGLSPPQVKDLQPWVRIACDTVFKKQESDREKPLESGNKTFKLAAGIKLELNGADSVALLRLPCIGPAFAKRILAYRKRLGGFVNADQLKEVYGLDEERFACLQDHIEIDLGLIERIPINLISEEVLRKHPYFRWNLVRSLCAFRKQHGPFSHTEDLLKLELMDSTAYRKIAPYISCVALSGH